MIFEFYAFINLCIFTFFPFSFSLFSSRVFIPVGKPLNDRYAFALARVVVTMLKRDSVTLKKSSGIECFKWRVTLLSQYYEARKSMQFFFGA